MLSIKNCLTFLCSVFHVSDYDLQNTLSFLVKQYTLSVEECLKNAFGKIDEYLSLRIEKRFCWMVLLWRLPKIALPWITKLKQEYHKNKETGPTIIEKLMNRAVDVSINQREIDAQYKFHEDHKLLIKPEPELVCYCQQKVNEFVSGNVQARKQSLMSKATKSHQNVLYEPSQFLVNWKNTANTNKVLELLPEFLPLDPKTIDI